MGNFYIKISGLNDALIDVIVMPLLCSSIKRLLVSYGNKLLRSFNIFAGNEILLCAAYIIGKK
jgi:hypothetical protein